MTVWRSHISCTLGLAIGWTAVVVCGRAFAAAPYGVRPDDEKRLKEARVAVDGPGLLAYLGAQTPSGAEQARAFALIARLGDDSFAVRQKASARLRELGPRVLPLLRRARGGPDAEVNDRLKELLAAHEKDTGPALRAASARLLRAKAPAGAVPVLLDLLPVADDDELEEEVLLTLVLLGVTDSKIDPALAAAVRDPHPARRRAAALVLGRSGTGEQRAAVKALLADADVGVRFRAAQGLLAGRDRAAVPALIALLSDAPPALYPRVEDLLFDLAGSRGPRYAADDELTPRRAARAAWTAWWRTNGKLDLGRADVELAPFRKAVPWRATARRFLHALADGDVDAVKKAAAVPFFFADVDLSMVENLEAVFGQFAPAWTDPPDSFALTGPLSADDFLRTAAPEDRLFVKRLGKAEVRVFPLQARQVQGRRQRWETALVLQLVEGQPRVVGIARIR